MSLFKIDTDRCDKDGICAIECPAHIIEMTKQGPVPAPGAEEVCIRCGHCVAVCPKGAFGLDSLSPDHCLPIQTELRLDADQTAHFLRSRRSIRRYRGKAVPREIFEKALALASHAPTGSNRQTVKWLVVDKRRDVQKIASQVIHWMKHIIETNPEAAQLMNMDTLVADWDKGIDRICRDAPQMVFAYGSDEFGSSPADCHIALSYLELALPGFGLGSCWAGYATYAAGQWPDLAKILNLPRHHTCHGALMVGYPKFRYFRAPQRNAPDITYHT